MKKKRKLGRGILIIAIILLFLLPFYVMFYLALSTPGHQLAKEWFPIEMNVRNFADAWTKSNMGNAMKNSIINTGGAIVLLVFCSASAGYAAARIGGRINRFIFNAMLLSMLVPGIINTVPLYIIMRKINGINTHWAMIFLLACMSLPISTFLYESFIHSSSKSLEEAAVIDGCTYFTAFWKITFPLLKPVTATVVIMQGVGIWNNYAQSVFFLQNQNYHTIPLAISGFFQTYGADYNLLAAGAMIGLLPMVAVFLVFQKEFVKGLSAGADRKSVV